MSGNSDWIVPVITASASLSGTIVGGLVTYWASRRNFQMTSEVARVQNLRRRVGKAAVGFVASLADTSMLDPAIDRVTQQWGAAATAVLAGGTDEELAAAARSIDPTIKTDTDRGAILYQLFRNSGVLDESGFYSRSSLSGLRLLAPEDVARSAHRVLFRQFVLQLTVALAADATDPARDALNREINDFFNRVRHYMSVKDIEFDFIDKAFLASMLPGSTDGR